jgi:lipopolysaccharide export system permease protein
MKPLSIIDAYLLRRQLACFMAVAAVVVAMSMVILIVQDLDNMMKDNASAAQAASFFLLKSPRMVVEYLPLITYISVLVNLGGLMRQREVSAMMALGVTHRRIAWPLLGFALLVSVGVFMWNETCATQAEAKANDMKRIIKHGEIKSRSEIQFLRGTHNRYYSLMLADEESLHHFEMKEMDAISFRSPRTILKANTAKWRKGKWYFKEAVLFHYDDMGRMVDREDFVGREMTYDIEETPEDFARCRLDPRDMRAGELLHHMQHYSIKRYWPELHFKFAYPLSALVLALLAIACTLSSWEEGFAIRMGLGLLCAPAYMALSQFCVSNALPTLHLAAWLPNLLFGLLGVVLMQRSSSY